MKMRKATRMLLQNIIILVFGTTGSSEKFLYSKIFIINSIAFSNLHDCITTFYDSSSDKSKTLYKITSIINKRSSYYYINDFQKLKSLFNCLQNVSSKERLKNILSEIKVLRIRLNT
ncbi:MAG: hypothetical protein JWN83_240 [Chitinophagaceae bacterium]|nr:hypothetical protein [Chitinophagaceae bacterium]